jgi:hypothetical protein
MGPPPGPPTGWLPLLQGVQPSLLRKTALVDDQIAEAWIAAEPYGPPIILHLFSSAAGNLAGQWL